MSRANNSLTSWLQNIKQHHDKRPSVTIVTPDEQKYVVSDPVVMAEHEHQDGPIVVANVEPPVAARASADANSVNDDDKSSTKSKPASIFSLNGARKFKNNLIHFHRPHGLLFQNHANQADHDRQHRESEENKQRQNSENSTDSHSSSCACCNPNGTSSNDADDEHEEQNQAENDSFHPNDCTKGPPCLCNTHISEAVEQNQDDDGASTHSQKDVSRDNSVFSLPEDIDNPEAGFKRLRKDGNMIDWDELSTFMEERDEDYDETNLPLAEYAKSRLFTRSVIRNDLVRLALNGPFQSPIHTDSKKHVLHVGCGDGSWCTETAKLFPSWLVVGVDDTTGGYSPDQRKAPKNFKYIRCYYDILKTLKDIPADSFDFIYVRFLLDAYGEDCYQDLLRECHRICKPEGYLELYELDMRIYGNPKAGPVTHRLNAKVFQTMEAHNLNPRLARKIGDLTSAIFDTHRQESLDQDTDQIRRKMKNCNSNYTSLPLGVWGGRLGVMFRDSINDLFTDFCLHDDKDIETSHDGSISSFSDDIPYDEDIEAMDKEMDSQKAFMNMHHVYVRKCSATTAE
ncbi:type 11 methyltransferase [Mucor ambiguus]|uniref:Type 11 methyltransferase n=1 Tax=Mucor ambiguus TaxID=91626 RepID=A0A0C9MDU0_9FUNG|nr:type 11 methyltransferase [Mucor ambiguus]